MKFQNTAGALSNEKSGLLVAGAYLGYESDSGIKSLDKLSDGLLDVATSENFTGKPGQTFSFRLEEGKTLVLIGLGDKNSFSIEQCRDYAARAVAAAAKLKAKSLSIAVPSCRATQLPRYAQNTVEGCILGTYSFDKYKSKKVKNSLETVRVLADVKGKKTKSIAASIKKGEITANAVCQARDLVNEPADTATPSFLANAAKKIAKTHGLKVKVYSAADCKKMGMNLYLAVGRGSSEAAKFIHLTYTPKRKATKKIALVGKGVTFDSGGYSLKPSASMMGMKVDMAGSAAVISSMAAIAQIGSKYEVHAIVAACENMVSGNAYKLGDVFKGMDGTTVEINNTDAEGRLTLADALTFARTKVKPDEIFDFATLTGACMVALGNYTAGVMSDHNNLAKQWLTSAENAGEDMWRLPLTKALRGQLNSPIADMKNTGERYGGAITAGLFLQNFAKDTPWVHTDIAGPASRTGSTPAIKKGGTGFAVATIVDYVTN